MTFLKFSKFFGIVSGFLFFTSSLALCMESVQGGLSGVLKQSLGDIISITKLRKVQHSKLEQEIENIRNRLESIEDSDAKTKLEYELGRRTKKLRNLKELLELKIGKFKFSEFGSMTVEELDKVIGDLSGQEQDELLNKWIGSVDVERSLNDSGCQVF